jgi:gluconate 5-dehydrogenase
MRPAAETDTFVVEPLGRFSEQDDVGMAAVYLCSPAAKLVTGVDRPGKWRMQN